MTPRHADALDKNDWSVQGHLDKARACTARLDALMAKAALLRERAILAPMNHHHDTTKPRESRALMYHTDGALSSSNNNDSSGYIEKLCKILFKIYKIIQSDTRRDCRSGDFCCFQLCILLFLFTGILMLVVGKFRQNNKILPRSAYICGDDIPKGSDFNQFFQKQQEVNNNPNLQQQLPPICLEIEITRTRTTTTVSSSSSSSSVSDLPSDVLQDNNNYLPPIRHRPLCLDANELRNGVTSILLCRFVRQREWWWSRS